MPHLPLVGSSGRRAPFLASAVALLLSLIAVPAFADGPQPAQKDSNVRAKPKDVTITATVEPGEAKPGDVVKLKVVANLKPGWHIYTYAEKQRDAGPRHTLFDAFDLAGLEKTGSWTASKEPESKSEPAFDNKTFEFFEDEVAWTLDLKVPADAAPGKKTVQVQASYQICNAQSCSFPGRWTLPGASLTVVGGQTANPPPAAAPIAAPKRPDTPEHLRIKGVSPTPSVEPVEVKPGGTVRYKVAVKLDHGLHIYDVAKPRDGYDGPIPTSFDLFETGGLVADPTTWKASQDPILKPEPAFGENVVVAFFEDEAAWTVELKVPADAKPGDHPIRSQITYQICNENACFPPTYQTLPEVVVKVGSPAAASPAVAFASPAPTQTPTAPSAVTPTLFTAPKETPATPVVAAAPPQASPAASLVAAAPAPAAATATAPEGPSVASAAAPISEIARTAQQGLIPFLIASALGGLFALVMPCVWPMVPITVNFFLKQGKEGKSKTTGLAFAYCLAIIGIFTMVGVFFSFFFSAAFLQNLANNPWLNLVVAALFLAFGLSLLGLFEISLPSFLLNASSKGESRGGLIGVIFMALTLTITSFTCTFPVVGGLLVMAAGGNFLYPIIGLATFATVLALPFFLLALAPGLLSKMPRSGDWMNSVKVVGGLVEIGAALKFLNTAELGYVTPENAWFDAQVVLTAWIVLAIVCGVYLLGLFRTDHDYDEVKVGPGRILFGCLFLGLGLYMTPALFGRPPQGLIWDRMIVGILPPDSSELVAEVRSAGTGAGEAVDEVKATSTDPAKAEREQKNLHGVLWGMSLDQAKEEAAAKGRPVLIDFTGVNCANCRLMERNVLPRQDVVKLLKKFVTVQLYTDRVPIASLTARQREDLALLNQERQLDLAAEQTNPFYVIMTPDGKVVSSIGGYNEPAVFQEFLTKALDKAQGGARVAQVGEPR
ncbi:protein-disulfide reductase DsbD family protein [Paludisphaera mucosa]|uniref:Protein-disulfide reductase DsbD family protein n=1 Tax=Paludisphaera mucosa TaxID=3030827 RepID=A0ABT6FFC1_9BACT|nr:protein-disulfide reductase DsbD domain-containing protein [Paludisphaera mucosa]MDG3006227.1 protein-disulfide reductase DsbD family protein [Paludisphaera mucosa]